MEANINLMTHRKRTPSGFIVFVKSGPLNQIPPEITKQDSINFQLGCRQGYDQ